MTLPVSQLTSPCSLISHSLDLPLECSFLFFLSDISGCYFLCSNSPLFPGHGYHNSACLLLIFYLHKLYFSLASWSFLLPAPPAHSGSRTIEALSDCLLSKAVGTTHGRWALCTSSIRHLYCLCYTWHFSTAAISLVLKTRQEEKEDKPHMNAVEVLPS